VPLGRGAAQTVYGRLAIPAATAAVATLMVVVTQMVVVMLMVVVTLAVAVAISPVLLCGEAEQLRPA